MSHRDDAEDWAAEIIGDSASSGDGRVLVWGLQGLTAALLAIDDTLREIRDRLPEPVPNPEPIGDWTADELRRRVEGDAA